MFAEIPPLTADTCQVWWATTSCAEASHRQLLDNLEAERWQRFRRDVDRDRMLVGVALAKTVLAGSLDLTPELVSFDRTCERCGRPHGKPRLAGLGRSLHFSVSHSGDRVGVAVSSRAPVGVDVEGLTARPHLDSLARQVLTEQEWRHWTAQPSAGQEAELIRAWTRKESALKATGDGLGLAMNQVGLTERDGRQVLTQWPSGAARPTAQLHDLNPGPGYLACVAVLDDAPVRITELDGTPLLTGTP